MKLNGWQDRLFREVAYRVADVAEPGSVAAITPYIALENIDQQSLHLNSVSRADRAVSGKTRFECGDVLFGKLRPYFRKVIHARFSGVCSTDIWVLRPREGVAQSFLFYTAASQRFVDHATRGSTGTKMPRADWKQVSQLAIPLPPLPEQREIASILGALDDKIELNRRMNATLEAMARALFQSWFVDFDPVRAKAEGRQPVGMDAETAALFPDSFEDSALGPIPTGWEVTTLRHLIGLLNGFAFKSRDWKESGVPVVKIGSVKSGYIELNEGSFVSEEMASAAARYALQAGDILIGMTGYVGEVGIMYDRSSSPLLNQRVGKFQFNRVNGWTMEASYPLLRHPKFRQFVIDRSVGSAQANVSSNAILEYQVVNATEQVMLSFGQVITPLVRQLIANYQELDQCRKHRDTLLPKLLSGELRVGDIAA